MAQAVRFDRYGGIDVLDVVEVDEPVPGPGQLTVQVVAAGINPGEAAIREGLLHERWPATFPSGQGSDLAGTVAALGDGVEGFAVGDDVLGLTHERASHASSVVVEAANTVHKPAGVPWDVAGSLHVAGTTAYAAVRAVGVGEDDVLVVAGAAGGVGSITVQLAVLRGAQVIGLAGEANHPWLSAHGVTPVDYHAPPDELRARIEAAAAPSGGKVDAFVDTFGGYVELALGLGVSPDRIDTIVDFAATRTHGVKFEGNAVGASAEVLAELAHLVDEGRLEVPIAATYPLTQVRDAYRQLEHRHTHGKIVLHP